MDTTLFAAAQAVKINQGMMPLDWGIIITMIVVLIAILIYCNRFMRNAADFLAASRCAGRYVLSIAEGVAGFAVVSSVATLMEPPKGAPFTVPETTSQSMLTTGLLPISAGA